MRTVTVVISVTMQLPDDRSIYAPLQEALSDVVERVAYEQTFERDHNTSSAYTSRDGTPTALAVSRLEVKQ